MTGYLDTRHPAGNAGPLLGTTPARPAALDWARRRRDEREVRRSEAARGRAVGRLARLGEQWKVVDVAEIGMENENTFLAIGPGGVFCVTVKAQGRSRVRLAGDVVQVDGKRPGYIAQATRAARQAGEALTRTAGREVPVVPILAFAGTGVIDVHGLPKNCLVTSYRELDHLLAAYGERIGPHTVGKLYSIARHPVTWVEPAQQRLIDEYTWYTQAAARDRRLAKEPDTAQDNRAAYR